MRVDKLTPRGGSYGCVSVPIISSSQARKTLMLGALARGRPAAIPAFLAAITNCWVLTWYMGAQMTGNLIFAVHSCGKLITNCPAVILINWIFVLGSYPLL